MNRNRILIALRTRLAEIEGTEQFKEPPAQVQVNAPLALVQVDLKAQHRTLRWCLDLLIGGENAP